MEDPNLSYILDNYEADVARNKIQSTETALAVWLGGLIPDQSILETIEHILLDSTQFKRLDIDQVQLTMKRIILMLGK